MQRRQSFAITANPGTLQQDLPVRRQPKPLQRSQDRLHGAGLVARVVEILDTDEPAPALMLGLEVAAEGGNERSEM
jgi:hypothetical protein